jgi:hypothetical protein
MSRTLKLVLLLCFIAVGNSIWAQSGGRPQGKPATPEKAKKMFMPQVYLGKSRLAGGPIKKRAFDSLLKQGITAYDSLGNKYKVVDFDFSYAERKLYEDSVGNLLMMMDFQSEHCKGDTLSAVLTTNSSVNLSTYAQTVSETDESSSMIIYDRTKSGDTLYFDHVRVLKNPGNKLINLPDSVSFMAKGMKFYIVK